MCKVGLWYRVGALFPAENAKNDVNSDGIATEKKVRNAVALARVGEWSKFSSCCDVAQNVHEDHSLYTLSLLHVYKP